MKHFTHSALILTRPYWLGLLLLTALLPGIAGTQPGPKEEDRILAQIKSRAETVGTFVATFRQKRLTRLLREPLLSEGLIYFEQDGNMLMQINKPSSLKLLFEGQYLTIINSKQALVYKKRLSATDRMMTTWIGFGLPLAAMKQQFNVRLAAPIENNRYRLTLTPQQEDLAQHIAAIEIEVDIDNLLPTQVVISETGGDRTTVDLNFLSINEPLPTGIFTIAIPESFPSR